MKLGISFPSIKTLLLIAIVVVCTIILTLLSVSLLDGINGVHLPGIGNIVALGYEIHGGDLILRDGSQTIDWGTIYVGGSTNRSFYLKSKSSTTTIPELNYGNWTFRGPEGQNVTAPPLDALTLTWNINNSSLAQNQEVFVTVTLTVEYDETFVEDLINYNIKTFSFDIAIEPTQV
jgi:hypothetical protein